MAMSHRERQDRYISRIQQDIERGELAVFLIEKRLDPSLLDFHNRQKKIAYQYYLDRLDAKKDKDKE